MNRLEHKVKWEPIDATYMHRVLVAQTWRTSVPSGWLVKDEGGRITYVPDLKHDWMKEAQ